MNYTELKKRALESYFSELNDKQREAVFQINGPVKIIAGAGSGKTTVLVNRIVNMVLFGSAYHDEGVKRLSAEQEKFLKDFPDMEKTPEAARKLADIIAVKPVQPWNILAVTFTKKAADELYGRIAQKLGKDTAAKITARTFHSICNRLLIKELGGDTFKICGSHKSETVPSSEDVIREAAEEQSIEFIKNTGFTLKKVKNKISNLKREGKTPEQYDREVPADDADEVNISVIYKEYESKLKEKGLLDFDDLILKMVKLVEDDDNVRNHYRNLYKYIMVDEYQDTDDMQYRFLDALAGKSGNICVVGDDDQSIYAFRGAVVDNILSFESKHENCKVIRLEQNYRSTKTILNAANTIIEKNKKRDKKTLWSDLDEGCRIRIERYDSPEEEARAVAGEIAETVKNSGGKIKFSDFAVLYRASNTSLARQTLISELMDRQVGCSVSKKDEYDEVADEDTEDYETEIAPSGNGAGNEVKVMTIHSAKGLEFPIVYIIAANDNSMPFYNAKSESEIEEERRLAYVAVTRAKERLVITYPQKDSKNHTHDLSRFFCDIPNELCERNAAEAEKERRVAAIIKLLSAE